MLLVTGATGFLGHALVGRLLADGYALRLLVRPGSDTTFLRDRPVELAVVDDIADFAGVRRAMDGVTRVVHAAAHFRFWGGAPRFWRTNVRGTAALLEAAAAAGVARFVHISTVAVAGTPLPGRIIDENYPSRPADPYQRSKLAAEQLVLAYQRERGLPAVVLRPGAFYGPWGRYAFNRLFFEEPLRGWRIRVDGGRHVTFPVYVADVADAVAAALTRGGAGRVYNVCGPSATHNELNDIVSDLAGISRRRLDIPSPLVLALAWAWTRLSRFTGREPFYPLNMAPYVFADWHVSSARAAAELGFEPTPFVDGARATLAWYREQGLIGG